MAVSLFEAIRPHTGKDIDSVFFRRIFNKYLKLGRTFLIAYLNSISL